MALNNRKCLCCNERYNYCPNCSGADRLAPSWKAEFCSETCKDLWLTCTRYNMQRLTKQEAQDVIKSLPLKPVSEYVQCVQRDLGVILKEEPVSKPKRTKRSDIQPVEPTVVEESKIETQPEVVEEITHEVVTIENE